MWTASFFKSEHEKVFGILLQQTLYEETCGQRSFPITHQIQKLPSLISCSSDSNYNWSNRKEVLHNLNRELSIVEILGKGEQ